MARHALTWYFVKMVLQTPVKSIIPTRKGIMAFPEGLAMIAVWMGAEGGVWRWKSGGDASSRCRMIASHVTGQILDHFTRPRSRDLVSWW